MKTIIEPFKIKVVEPIKLTTADERNALIDAAGLKGARVGGAEISKVHANFIVTNVGACAGDVLALIDRVRTEVSERTGILLEPEVEILGEAAP